MPSRRSSVASVAGEGASELSTNGGLFKSILRPGNPRRGTPPLGAKVKVHYTGSLLDGTEFDSSRDRAGFFEFTLGRNMVIKGWDVGIASMEKGEVCMLTCRADYAYGAGGFPPAIPANATLKFEVELFSWKEDQAANNSALGASGLSFFALLALVIAVLALVARKHTIASGALGITVVAFVAALYLARRRKAAYLSGTLERAMVLKESGTTAFAAQQWGEALDLYADAIEQLESLVSSGPPAAAIVQGARYGGDEEAARELMIACLLNQANCHLKLGEWDGAERCCERLLDGSLLEAAPEVKRDDQAEPTRRSEQHVKALYRRAHARMELERFGEAKADLLQASVLDPRSREVRAMYAACGEREAASRKRQDESDRGLYAKMF